MSMLQYKPAVQEDVPLIFAQGKALIDRYEDLSRIDYTKVLSWMKNKITAHVSQYTCVWFAGKKAGYYRITQQNGMRELDDLYILPEFRNKGIGSAVISKCCTESEEPVFLYVFTKNVRAIAFYKRHGFSVSEQVSPTRCIMMRRP